MQVSSKVTTLFSVTLVEPEARVSWQCKGGTRVRSNAGKDTGGVRTVERMLVS